ncbi:MAG: HesA/MoeB/ThiF family protein [Pseudomonadota bacterium]
MPEFGDDGVAQLRQASVLIVGLGGTGAGAALALAGAGVGTITLNDFDDVDESNLARQTLYRPQDVGKKKALVAQAHLAEQNPTITLNAIQRRLDADELAHYVGAVDVVLDCCDNFSSRFAINRAAVATRTPLVSGAAIRWEGQISVFGPDYETGPCYQCLYQADDEGLDDCQGAGVVGPLPPMIGQLMAIEAIKKITGSGYPAAMLIYDARSASWHSVNINRREDCSVCG